MGERKKGRKSGRRRRGRSLSDTPVEGEDILNAIKEAINAAFGSPPVLAQIKRGTEEATIAFFEKRFVKK